MPRSFNPNLVKSHHCYKVEEVAALYHCHKNTVRRWLKNGLTAIDDSRPMLIKGAILKSYLIGQRIARKKTCKQGEMYCMKCKNPRRPLQNEVWWIPQSSTTGRLVGCCEVCGSTINRFAKVEGLAALSDIWSIKIEGKHKRIGDSDKPALNGDFDGGD